MSRPFCTTNIHYKENHPYNYDSIWPLIVDFVELFTTTDTNDDHHNMNISGHRFDAHHSDMAITTPIFGNSCSVDTIFVWIPAILLLLCSPIEIAWIRYKRRHRANYLASLDYLVGGRNQQATTTTTTTTMGPILVLNKKTTKTPESMRSVPVTIYYACKIFLTSTLYIVSIGRIIYWSLYTDSNPLGLLDPWAPVLADIIKAVAWFIILILYAYFRRNQNLSSWSIFIFLVTECAANIYSSILIMVNMFGDGQQSMPWLASDPWMVASKVLYIASVYYLFFMECLSDDDSAAAAAASAAAAGYKQKSVDKRDSLREKLNSPERTASFFAKLTFSWFTRLVWKAWRKRTVHQEDLWLLSEDNVSNVVLRPFKNVWIQQQNQGSETDIMMTLFKIYYKDLLWIALLKLISSLFLFVNPVVLDWIITYLNPNQQSEPYWRGFFYASLMFLAPMLESMFTNQHEYHINLVTMKMKTCVTCIIYNKSLRLSNSAKQSFSTGEIVNLISVDVFRIVDLVNNINTLWAAPLQICVGVYLLWLQLRYAAFAGFSYMLFIVPINIALTNKLRLLQLQLMTKKDGRSKIMNEILNGIKVIKLNAWERHFEKKVSSFRQQEIQQLKNIAYCQTFMTTFFSSGAVFVALFSFATYTLISSDNVLDANKAFVSLSLFNIIRVPLTFLPMFFSFAGIAFVSIERIDDYLNLPEIGDYKENTSTVESDGKQHRSMKPDDTIAIRITNGNFNWIEDDPVPTINSVNLEIAKRSLVTIIGGVGSGKTSLLCAILGEMEKLSGHVQVNGKIAYVPQEAWILNATIRENIILNKKYDEKKYKKVLEACSLQVDLAMFAAGDMTEVGEKGTNLSGGQKQRISLARAVYSNSDIYLLDNPLSALDVHVGQHIFQQVIGPKGCLRNKTRLLVTTKMSLLPHVDQIIYISRGEIKEMGTFDQLIHNRGPFSQYVAEYFIDHQSGFPTNLDDDDVSFVQTIEPKIQPVIERMQSSHSVSLQRNISITETRHHSTFASQAITRSISKSVLESDEMFAENINISQGKLIQAEEISEGAVSSANHKIYFKTIGFCLCFSILITLFLSNVSQVLSSLWLSDWSNDALRSRQEIGCDSFRNKRILVFSILGIIEVFFTFLGTLKVCLGCVRASKTLHNQMFNRIIRAPMSFFDTSPIGRILNRFTRDIDVIDLRLSTNFRIFVMQIFRTMVALGLIGMEAPIILVFILPLIIAYYVLQKVFINTSRQLKRIEAVTRSPMNNHLSETVNGTTSIRAYGLTKKFMREMLKRVDENNRSYWLSFVASRWLAVRLEFLGYSIVFLATLMAVLSRGLLSPGVAGLAISYSLNITSILNMLIRAYSEIETNFVSVERIVEYMDVPKEKQLLSSELARIPLDWPLRGEIVFENYSTQYRPGLKLCLKRINLTIPAGSKVAIIGRTGSGKSSLSLALFRILDPVEGTIFIDNIDIKKITLETLRKSLTIVPQEPVLFSGTLKENVDVLQQHHDETTIIQALIDAKLGPFLESINNDINYQLNSGDNLSVGQRQLICLARALLKQSSIIVFDEATASVDHQTDSYIQDTIFSARFKSKTVLMIAHRLDRIMDYDYILVMDNGETIEFDNPHRLVTRTESQFYSLAKEANII